VLALLRHRLDAPQAARIELPAGSEGALLSYLRRHGLGGWAWHGLRQDRQLSEALRQGLRADWRTTQARSITALAEYERISAALSDAGVRHVPIKGMELLRTLYPDPGLRNLTDLDLLVDPGDFAAAHQALGGLGFEAGAKARASEQRYTHHVSYGRKGGVFRLELHQRLALDFKELVWSEAMATASHELRLPPSATLYSLLLHAARHANSMSLKWLLDIRLWLERYPDSAAAVRALSQRGRTLGACSLAARMTHGLTGSAAAGRLASELSEQLPRCRAAMVLAAASPGVVLCEDRRLRSNWVTYVWLAWLPDAWGHRTRTVFDAFGFKLSHPQPTHG
jgi:hypothetical protein